MTYVQSYSCRIGSKDVTRLLYCKCWDFSHMHFDVEWNRVYSMQKSGGHNPTWHNPTWHYLVLGPSQVVLFLLKVCFNRSRLHIQVPIFGKIFQLHANFSTQAACTTNQGVYLFLWRKGCVMKLSCFDVFLDFGWSFFWAKRSTGDVHTHNKELDWNGRVFLWCSFGMHVFSPCLYPTLSF